MKGLTTFGGVSSWCFFIGENVGHFGRIFEGDRSKTVPDKNEPAPKLSGTEGGQAMTAPTA